MVEECWDEAEGGFFFTGKSHETLIVRSKDYFDNATPSGNSVAAHLLLRLATLTGDEDLRRMATTVLRLVAQSMNRYPSGFGRALCASDFYLSSPLEIALVGDPTSSRTKSLKRALWGRYVPNKVVAPADAGADLGAQMVPLLQDRTSVTEPTAYVCEQFACKTPVTSADEFGRLLDQIASAQPSQASKASK
jgi:uncharacterized protein YyaL (SSP411 family)